jgi:hypothetical protein
MKLIFLFIFAIIFSCNSSEKTITGIYTSKKQNKFDKLFDTYDYWAIGTTIKLEKDSTFYMKTCGNIGEGNWKIKKDSLLLYPSSIKYAIDSLNKIPEWKAQLKTTDY